MSVYKCHAFIFLDQPPPWPSRTLLNDHFHSQRAYRLFYAHSCLSYEHTKFCMRNNTKMMWILIGWFSLAHFPPNLATSRRRLMLLYAYLKYRRKFEWLPMQPKKRTSKTHYKLKETITKFKYQASYVQTLIPVLLSIYSKLGCLFLKGTVPPDFSPLFFFFKQLLLAPVGKPSDDFDFFRIFAEIFDFSGASPVSLTPAKQMILL